MAVEAGYEGTYDEWEEQVRTVAGFGVDFDPSTGTLTFGV